MYLLSEVAKIIGVSRQSVYKKIDKENLQEYLTDSDKGKVLSEKGLNVLKGLFGEYIDSKQATDKDTTSDSCHGDNLQSELTAQKQIIEMLKDQNEYLKSVISEKDKQLTKTSEVTTNLTRLLENSQVLLKQSQEKILLLENPPEEKDDPVKGKSFLEKVRYVFSKS